MSKSLQKITQPGNNRGFHVTSASTGAFEFLPVPFLDEWLIRRQRMKMVENILRERGVTFDPEVPAILVSGEKTLLSRLGSVTRGLILKPVRKLFRSVLFWLTAKSAAKTAMVTYFLARLLHHPGIIEPDRKNHLTTARARILSKAFSEISEGIDVRAVRNTFGKLTHLFARRKQTSGNDVAKTIEESAPGFISEFDQLVEKKLLSIREDFSGGDRTAS